MNWEHLKAFLWLRWRLVANRNKRAGTASVVLQTIVMAAIAAAGLLAFILGIGFGAFALPSFSAQNFMLVWDAAVVAFIFFWMIELMVELQRSELLSLDKFLHLPVSLSGAFLINFVGSISSAGAAVFLPLMLGLSAGLVVSKGPVMLLMFPLVAAFALMVTALTHQFRGWLAALMTNQRRRRTVMVVVTFAFVLIVQTPNLIGFSGMWRGRFNGPRSAQAREQIQTLDRSLAEGKITEDEHSRQVQQLRGESREEQWKRIYGFAKIANQAVPLGWLPYGATAIFEGKAPMALLGTLGLALIGVASLRRSYLTTQRLYTGHFSSKKRGVAAPQTKLGAPASIAKTGKYAAAFLETRLPLLSEHASAVAAACLRSLLRAPEAKMMLLSPLVMLLVFGGMFMAQRNDPPELARPLMAAGGVTFMLFMMVGLIGNTFGSDRGGFRVFVLASAPRKDILLGKNLSLAPFALAFTLGTVMVLQLVYPMRVDHYLAALIQTVPMYLLFCLIGNMLSIMAPMPIAPGSLKPAKPKGMTILIQLGFAFLFPLAMAPTLIPLAIEFLLVHFGAFDWFPAYLVLTLAELAAVLYLYRALLERQGSLLARREQRILETVTSKVE